MKRRIALPVCWRSWVKGVSRGWSDRDGRRAAQRFRMQRVEVLEARTLLSVGPLASNFRPDAWDLGAVSLDASTSDSGRWLDFDPEDGIQTGLEPQVELLPSSADEILGEVRIAGAWLEGIQRDGREFVEITVPGYGYTDVVGQPQLPVIRQTVAVPEGAVLDAHVSGTPKTISLVELGIDSPLLPLQPPVVKSLDPQAQPLTIDEASYSTDTLLPSAPIRLVEAGRLGGQRMVMAEIVPVSYNPAAQTVTVFDTLSFDIDVKMEATETVAVASADALRLAGLAASEGAAQTLHTGRLLIITEEHLLGETLDRFVEHKRSLGWTVDVFDTRTTGEINWEIRDFIYRRYWPAGYQYGDPPSPPPVTRPGALLLIGDTTLVPHFVGVTVDSPDTDLYYTCMDYDDQDPLTRFVDWYPEFPVGRFSVTNIEQLSNVVEKTIEYETMPNGDWMHRAAFMASEDNWQITEATHNYIINNYMIPWGYTSARVYTHTYHATTPDVAKAINEGRAWAVYSGHGGEYLWADGPVFTQPDVHALVNAGMYPFVASFACLTGRYNFPESFAETWQRQPTRAGVEVFASSTYSYWTEDDILEKSLFSAIYDDRITDFGGSVLRAKDLYLQYFGLTPTTQRYFEMYNLFGDPTAHLRGMFLRIDTAPDLPVAYRGSTYQVALTAYGGTRSYDWQVIDGQLPPGLTLSRTSGVISGTPTQLGNFTFTIQVEDTANGVASREFHLSVVERLLITAPGTSLSAAAGVPYSVTFAAQGGTQPYSWAMLPEGRFEENQIVSQWVGGGIAQNWRDDEATWRLDLPWAFPYYGQPRTYVYVSSNGFLDFRSNAAAPGNSRTQLQTNARVAPLWDDLVTNFSEHDNIFVTQTQTYVVIRWAAHTYNGNYPVNVEVILYRNGDIVFNYGEAHTGLTPTVGVSAGNNTHYTISPNDNLPTIPGFYSARFTYHDPLPPGLVWDETTHTISGTPTESGSYDFRIVVQDSGVPQQTASNGYSLYVAPLPSLVLNVAADVWEGDGALQGMVSLPARVSEDVTVYLVSSDPGELAVSSPVTIPANQLSAPVFLSVGDDAQLDWIQNVMLTASAEDYSSVTQNVAVHDNETAGLSVMLPVTALEGSSVQGTVRASQAPTSDVQVVLLADDVTEAIVPTWVTLPAGATEVPFTLAAVDDGLIDGDHPATVTARVENWTDGAAVIEVLDADDFLTVLLPEKLWEGWDTMTDGGVVTLGGVLPSDLLVTLASSDTTELQVPLSVTIPAGQVSAPFDLAIQDDPEYDGRQVVTVAAAALGVTGAGRATAVGDNDVHHYGFYPIADPQRAGVDFDVTIRAEDINNELIEVFVGPVTLDAAGDLGPLPLTFHSAKSAAAEPVADPIAYDPLAAPEPAPKAPGVYHSYASLTADLAGYVSAYPNLCSRISIGQSVEGRDLWAMKISDNPYLEEDEPEIKFVGAIHGNERLGTEMCVYFIDHLLRRYASDSRVRSLVDRTEIWIVPMMNPDGVDASPSDRENANGIDLNRDFPEGALSFLGNVFDGPAMDLTPHQPEVARMMEWSAEQSFTLAANFHTGSLVVNYPYDNDRLGNVDSPTPDDELFEYIAQVYASHNAPMFNSTVFPGGITNGAAWYTITGGMQDWDYRYLSCNEVTVELSNTTHPAQSLLPTFWDDNRESMLAYAEAALLGIRGIVTDATTDAPVYAKVMVSRNSHPVFTDPQVGDYHRMLLPGTYTLTFAAPGYFNRTVENVVVGAAGTTRVDVHMTPRGDEPYIADGLWTGRISIDGLDANVVLTVRDAEQHIGRSNSFDVVHGPFDHFQFSPIPSPQQVGSPLPVTITALDDHGFPVLDFNGSLRLRGSLRASAPPIEIGTGSMDYPIVLATSSEDCRTQVIYLKEEIGGPVTLRGLALRVIVPPGQTLHDWTIRLKHTASSEYVLPLWESSGWTTVYQAQETISTTSDWVTFVFDTPFVYNGVDNLMVDFSFNNDSISTTGRVDATDTGRNRILTYSSNSQFGDPLSWSASSPPGQTGTYIPNIRLVTEGPISVAPAIAGRFVGGVWSDNVTVLEEADEMFLSVTDGGSHTGTSGLFAVVPPFNHAPTLDTGGSPALPDIAEDEIANSGMLVADLIASALPIDMIADDDPAALEGIAVVGVDNSHGRWEFSLNNGTTWTPFGTPAENAARLLAADAGTRVRFVPESDYFGAVAQGLSLRAWDQTSGVNGGIADVSINGGVKAFSAVVETVSIKVTSVNDEPEIAAANPPAVDEDSGTQTLAGWAGFLPGAANESAQKATYTLSGLTNTALFSVAPLVAPDGTLSYTPAPNASGTATFQLAVQDDGGTANGGDDTSAPRTFTITVLPVNDPPTLAASAPSGILEDSGLQSISLSGILAGGGETQALQVTAHSGNPLLTGNLTVDYTSPAEAGQVRFTPAPDWNGTTVITVAVHDAGLDDQLGTEDDGVLSQDLTVFVEPVNDRPFAYARTILMAEDTPKRLLLRGNDMDPRIYQALTFGIATPPSFGTLSGLNPATGEVFYTPGANFTGTDVFTFTITDDSRAGGAPLVSAPGVIKLRVVAVNDQPYAYGQTAVLVEDTPQLITLRGNDMDPRVVQTLTFAIITPPQFGTLSELNPATGEVLYTPGPDYTGIDTFTFTVTDDGTAGSPGPLTSEPREVKLKMTAVNDQPYAYGQAFNVQTGNTKDVTLRGNDMDPRVHQALTFAIVTPPQHGSLSGFNPATGAVRYTPTPGYLGQDSFAFTVTDDGNAGNPANLVSQPGTVTIEVVAAANRAAGSLPSTAKATSTATTSEKTALSDAAYANPEVLAMALGESRTTGISASKTVRWSRSAVDYLYRTEDIRAQG